MRKYCIVLLYLRIIVFNEFMAIVENKNGFLFARFGRNLRFLLCVFWDYAARFHTSQEFPKNAAFICLKMALFLGNQIFI